VSSYGIIDGEEFAPGLFRYAVWWRSPRSTRPLAHGHRGGRYVLFPDIFYHPGEPYPGHGGEIQLTDALKGWPGTTGSGRQDPGPAFDAGDWAEYLTANIYFALHDEELREALVPRLRQLLPFSS
jgi:UTP--glucose-1-phosphate uridylyltransferase